MTRLEYEEQKSIEKEGIKKAKSVHKRSRSSFKYYRYYKKEKPAIKNVGTLWNIYNKTNRNKKHKKKEGFLVSAKTGLGIETLIEAIYSFILKKKNVSKKMNFFIQTLDKKIP